MFKVIESHAKCEIRFLTARNMSAADIHRQWVPILLTVEHKEKRFVSSLKFLILYEEERDYRLRRIVTGYETWLSHITPE
ncbi:hypothetical protein TNCV_1053361 [Trichonephila clavipes]|nr:hypothetical protein TNCV_1053361 [Trichonephila clavipes]